MSDPSTFPDWLISSGKFIGGIISSDHTPYSFKHTGIIHLKMDGGQVKDIMELTGHTPYHAYSEYLRI